MLEVLIAFSLSFLISLTSSDSISPIFGTFHGDSFSADGVLFMYDAKAILQGKTPYLEVFDHKGLYHIGINILGLLINEAFGVFILEIIFQAITLFVVFEMLHMMEMSIIEKAVAIGFFLVLRLVIGGGNAIGTWLLPFVAAYLYFYSRALKESKDSYFIVGSIFLGIEIALALNSRLLDAVYSYGGLIWFLMYAIKNRKMKVFWMNALIAFGSFAIVTGVFVAVAASGGYFAEMAEAALLENFIYIGRTENFPLDQVFFRIGSGLLVLIAILFERLEKRWGANIVIKNLLLTLMLSIFVPCIFLGRYLSYLTGGLPIFAVWFGYFFHAIPKGKVAVVSKLIPLSILSVGTILLSSLTPTLYYTTGVGDFSFSKNKQDETVLLATIPEEDRNDKDVFAIDCSCAVYLALDVTAEQRFYANQSWWALDNENVLKETITFIKEKSPKWLIVAKDEESLTNYGDALLSYELVSEEASRFYIYRLKAN